MSEYHAQGPQVVQMQMPINVGPNPATLTCPSCQSVISTRVEYNSTTKTHIMAGLLCLFCCWPCVCIPYCMNTCRNGNHYCPQCNAFIGTYNG